MIAATTATAWQTERELVERHRCGDPRAFEAIYAEHERLVFNLALRLSGDPDRAADLSQEVFLRVYRGLGRFRGRSSLKTWIYRVALNCCRARLRTRRWAAPVGTSAEGLDELADPRRGPEESAAARESKARLERALVEVPLVYREAVVLRDLQGLDYAEIARLLSVRIGTVRSRIARGRERLRRVLEEED